MNELENVTTVAAEAANVVATPATVAPAVTVPNNDGMSLGKKIAFYGFIALLAISGVGIPIAIILIKKKNKQLDRYKELYGELPPEQPKAVVAAPAPAPVAVAVTPAPVQAAAPVATPATPETK